MSQLGKRDRLLDNTVLQVRSDDLQQVGKVNLVLALSQANDEEVCPAASQEVHLVLICHGSEDRDECGPADALEYHSAGHLR